MRHVLPLIAASSFAFLSIGCGVPMEDEASTEPSSEMNSAAPEAEVSQSGFNDCVCLDPSQVVDCRSGTCYCSRWDGTYSQYYCSSGAYYYTCKHYVSYKC